MKTLLVNLHESYFITMKKIIAQNQKKEKIRKIQANGKDFEWYGQCMKEGKRMSKAKLINK